VFDGRCPSFWNNVFNLAIGHCGQAGQDVAQISVGLDTMTAAAFDDRVNDRFRLLLARPLFRDQANPSVNFVPFCASEIKESRMFCT
jgi:hypothetical protein